MFLKCSMGAKRIIGKFVGFVEKVEQSPNFSTCEKHMFQHGKAYFKFQSAFLIFLPVPQHLDKRPYLENQRSKSGQVHLVH